MATELTYLNDFVVLTGAARVLSVNAVDDDSRTDVVLDRTCFYPRGGGQDWDTGVIRGASGDFTADFTVEEVRLDPEGVVHHLGAGPLAVGDEVSLQVDVTRRMVNTRLHSAGHVVDLAVERLGLPWVPGKGAHYPHMSFVEYDAVLPPEEVEAVLAQVQQAARGVIDAGSSNEIRFMPVSEMGAYCRNVPANIPTNKPARIVLYTADFGVPCGGTHVADVSGIGTLTITKIKSKKGLTKVSYAVDGIN
ncbi:alanine--tRNA ligase-related protein [Arthrobacter sp. H20]|uniref:alanine--tRNA ligase-related protein n=1 Tax=Arthrobacter sp. H20 TaxID=1267981 RepID=UPI00047B23D5|nr:alanine--tRNA ligase-related protein [Arthrobacter sp. H20]